MNRFENYSKEQLIELLIGLEDEMREARQELREINKLLESALDELAYWAFEDRD